MSDIWIPYGGGADLDPVTAVAADVRKGKTIVDKDGNPIGGTMPDIAGRTITPTTSQQTLNGGGYLTGNVVVPGFTAPPANVIKKGYTLNVFGIRIMGSWEGYVPGSLDIYNRGSWGSGYSQSSLKSIKNMSDSDWVPVPMSFAATNISLSNTWATFSAPTVTLNKLINLTPYKKINAVVSVSDASGNIAITVHSKIPSYSDESRLSYTSVTPAGPLKEATISADISGLNIMGTFAILCFSREITMRIFRIYFS